jgi:hypothetical protein
LPITELVSPVRHALNLLGQPETIRWIRMATTLPAESLAT